MTPAQAAYRAGCIASEVEHRLAPKGFTPALLGNLSRLPSGLAVYLRHLWAKVTADPDLVAMLDGFDPPPQPVPGVDQGAFWIGYYHQKSVRDLPVDFARRLQALRERAGLSREQLATAAGLTRQGVNDLETGATRTPSWPTVQKLAAALGVSTDALRDR